MIDCKILFNSLKILFNKDNFHFQIWQILTSIAFTAGSAGAILSYLLSQDFLTLHNFHDRTIGIVILTATDASRRTELYVCIWIYAFLVFCAILLCLAFITKKYLKNLSVDFERKMFFCLSLFSMGSLCLFALSQQTRFLSNYLFLMMLLSLVGIIVILKIVARENGNTDVQDLFSNANIIIVSFIVPYISIIIYWIFSDQKFLKYTDFDLILYAIIWAFFVAVYYFIRTASKKKKSTEAILDDSLIKSFVPLLIIPAAIPLSNELQYTLAGSIEVLPATLTKLSTILLIIIAICIFFVNLKRQRKESIVSGSSCIQYLYFPMILLSAGLFQYHRHFSNMKTYDIFHDGERLIPAQQLFEFHKLPFIDLLPTHGLSALFDQLLFSLINGYSPVQPITWSWIAILISIVILYFAFSKLTTPIFAFFFCLFLPGIAIVGTGEPYIFCLVSVFTLIWAIKKPSFSRFCLHWLMILFLVVFRLDFGPAAMVGTIFVLSVLLLRDRINHRTDNALPLKVLFLSALCTFGIAFIAYCGLLYLSGNNIFSTLSVNIQFITYQAPIQAYQRFYNEMSFKVILEYIVFPIIALFFIAYFVLDHIFCNHERKETQIILAFIAAMTLALSIRTVQRHSMAEGFNAILYPLLLILIPLNLKFRGKQLQYIAIIGLLILYIIVVPSFSVIAPNKNVKLFEYHPWTPDESRIIDDRSNYRNLTDFLGNTLAPDETFYDFSNAPLIYVFTNREFVQYLIPNIYQSSEVPQYDTIRRLDTLYQQQSVPIVLFKQSNWWDQVDGVPNEIRSYRITEYIYSHYRPAGYIDNKFQIWVGNYENNLSIRQFEQQRGFTPATNFAQIFRLKRLPYIWGTYDPYHAVSETVVLANLTDSRILIAKGKIYTFPVDPDIDKSSGNYLYLRMNGSQISNVTVLYGATVSDAFVFTTEPTSKEENYLIRLSSQWKWMDSRIENISIKSDRNIELLEMNIRKGD